MFYPYIPQQMKGRIVSSVDEVRAAQIDLDGSTTYFPCPAQNVIYAKSINMQGLPVVQEFRMVEPPKPPAYVTQEMFNQLVSKVEQLERGVGNVQSAGNNEASIQP